MNVTNKDLTRLRELTKSLKKNSDFADSQLYTTNAYNRMIPDSYVDYLEQVSEILKEIMEYLDGHELL